MVSSLNTFERGLPKVTTGLFGWRIDMAIVEVIERQVDQEQSDEVIHWQHWTTSNQLLWRRVAKNTSSLNFFYFCKVKFSPKRWFANNSCCDQPTCSELQNDTFSQSFLIFCCLLPLYFVYIISKKKSSSILFWNFLNKFSPNKCLKWHQTLSS